MIIEHFRAGFIKELYNRFDKKGRMLPSGVHYLNSWIDEKIEVCYQLMESESLGKLEEWISHWDDLADFEIIPIIDSQTAKMRILKNDLSN